MSDELAQFLVRPVSLGGKPLGEVARVTRRPAARPAERHARDPEGDGRRDPRRSVADVFVADEREPEDKCAQCAEGREHHGRSRRAQEQRDLARTLPPKGRDLKDSRRDGAGDEQESGKQMEEEEHMRHARSR